MGIVKKFLVIKKVHTFKYRGSPTEMSVEIDTVFITQSSQFAVAVSLAGADKI